MSVLREEPVAEALTRVLDREGQELVSAYLFGSLAEGRAHRESDAAINAYITVGLAPWGPAEAFREA